MYHTLGNTYRHICEQQEKTAPRIPVSTAEARKVGEKIGVDFEKVDLEQFRLGMEAEFEHGKNDPETNVTDDDPDMTGKIAWAHIKEVPDYYDRLEKLESDAHREQS